MAINVFIGFVLVVVGASKAGACSICGCGDPLQSAGSAHPLANTFRLAFENVYLAASAQSDDLASTESVRQINLNTTLTYSPVNDLTLSVMLPVVEKYWSLLPPGGPGAVGTDTGTPFGIGDVMVGVRYFFWQDPDYKIKLHQAFAASVGTYIPTGGTDFVSQITGNNLDTHSQLGTGAWGLYGGLLYNRLMEDFTLNVNFNVIVHTTPATTDPNSPVFQYTFGTSYTGGISGQLNVTDSLAISLALEGRYATSDTKENDQGTGIRTDPNTGGTVLDLSPGLSWNITGDSTLYAKVQIPIYTNLIGVQKIDPTYIVGTQFLFK